MMAKLTSEQRDRLRVVNAYMIQLWSDNYIMLITPVEGTRFYRSEVGTPIEVTANDVPADEMADLREQLDDALGQLRPS